MHTKVYDAPFRPGWWWMYDNKCFGWEVVRVFKLHSDGTFCIERAGESRSQIIPPHVSKWVEIEEPDVN